MITITLPEYAQGRAVSWAKADRQHIPGMWRRDLSFPGLPIPARFVTECQACGVTMKAEGTEFGTITKVLK